MFGFLDLLKMVPSRTPYSQQTAKLEEDPIRRLKETLQDSLFRSLQTQSETYQGMFPGREYYINAVMDDRRGHFEDLIAYGPIWARWVVNRSGSTLSQGALVKWQTSTVTNIDSGAVDSITKAAEWVADEQVGNLLYCLDDDSGVGTAPEGESRFITKNTINQITVQPDFSAAPAINDDFEIISNSAVIASAAGDDRSQVAGVVLSPDDIADNVWGWVGFRGYIGSLIKAATAITKGQRLIADVGRLDAAAAPNAFEDLGFAVVGCSADIVSDLIIAKLELP